MKSVKTAPKMIDSKKFGSEFYALFRRLYSGRLNRVNFWIGLIATFLVIPIILLPFMALIESIGLYSEPVYQLLQWFPAVVFILWPLSISVRRLHDSDKNGLFLLFVFLPLLNLLVFYWLAGARGSPGNNKYGPKDSKPSIKKVFTGK